MYHRKNFIFYSILLSFLLIGFGCSSHPEMALKEMNPVEKKAELYYDHGTKALVAKDYTEALINLKKAIALVNDDSRFFNNLGMAYYFKKDVKTAIKHLERAIHLDEKNSDAQNNLASLFFNEGALSKAQSIYLHILKNLEYPKQYRTYYNLGLIELKKRHRSQAISYLKKSSHDNKSYCPTQFLLGQIHYEDHNYHKAAQYFQNASLGSCSKNPTPYFQEALSLLSLGEEAKALLKFENIIKKFPTSREAILSNEKIQTLNLNNYKKNQKIIKSKKKYDNPPLSQKKENEAPPIRALQF